MPSQTTTPRTEDVLSAAERLIGQLDDNAGAVRRLRLHGLTGRITGALPSPTSHTLGGLDSSAISLERSLDQGRASMGAMLCQSLWNHAGISMSSCVHNATLDLGHDVASRQGSASQQQPIAPRCCCVSSSSCHMLLQRGPHQLLFLTNALALMH